MSTPISTVSTKVFNVLFGYIYQKNDTAVDSDPWQQFKQYLDLRGKDPDKAEQLASVLQVEMVVLKSRVYVSDDSTESFEYTKTVPITKALYDMIITAALDTIVLPKAAQLYVEHQAGFVPVDFHFSDGNVVLVFREDGELCAQMRSWFKPNE
jgi:hypothetical protein